MKIDRKIEEINILRSLKLIIEKNNIYFYLKNIQINGTLESEKRNFYRAVGHNL